MNVTQSDLEKVVQGLLRVHGSKIISVALFGNAARGEEDERSDMNFIVVVRELPSSLERRYLLYEPIYEALNKGAEDIRDITILDVDESDIFNDKLEVGPLLMNIAWDAKIIYDPEGKLLKFVNTVKRLVEAAGLDRYKTNESKYGWKPKAGGLRSAVLLL